METVRIPLNRHFPYDAIISKSPISNFFFMFSKRWVMRHEFLQISVGVGVFRVGWK